MTIGNGSTFIKEHERHTPTVALNFTWNAMLTTPKSENFNSGLNNTNIKSASSFEKLVLQVSPFDESP